MYKRAKVRLQLWWDWRKIQSVCRIALGLETISETNQHVKCFNITFARLTESLEISSCVTGRESNCILIPSDMSHSHVIKQLIHNTTSYVLRLQSVEHCQAFIIPSAQMKLHKELKPYITLRFGPHIIISVMCRLLQGALFIQECALDKTYRPFKKLFRPCQESSANPWLFSHQNSSH